MSSWTRAIRSGRREGHQPIPSDLTLRVKSLESLLVEKGAVDRAALDALVDTYKHKIGPRNGTRVVARAWIDPAYKQRLLADPDHTSPIEEFTLWYSLYTLCGLSSIRLNQPRTR